MSEPESAFKVTVFWHASPPLAHWHKSVHGMLCLLQLQLALTHPVRQEQYTVYNIELFVISQSKTYLKLYDGEPHTAVALQIGFIKTR